MKKFMFVEFCRYDVCDSEVLFVEGESKEEVARKVMKDVFLLDGKDLEESLEKWVKRNGEFGYDGEEYSYLVVEVSS